MSYFGCPLLLMNQINIFYKNSSFELDSMPLRKICDTIDLVVSQLLAKNS